MRQYISTRKFLAIAIMACSLFAGMTDANAKRNKKEGFLGVTVESLSREDKKEKGIAFGVLVWEVMEDSPAEKAGIREDDVIQYYDSKKVRDPDDLFEYVRGTEPGADIQIAVLRDGEPQKITAAIGTRKYSNRDTYHCPMLPTTKGYLGVKLQDINEGLAGYFDVKEDEGALVLEVNEDSPAEEAGIKPGDVILKIDNEAIREAQDVKDLLGDYQEGDVIALQIKRRGKIQTINVEPGSVPRMFDFEFNFPKHRDSHQSSHRIIIPDIDMDWDAIGEDIQIEIDGELRNLGEELQRYFEDVEMDMEI